MKESEKPYRLEGISQDTRKQFDEYSRIGQRAIDKAIAENKRLGIPNYWSIDGRIVSDRD